MRVLSTTNLNYEMCIYSTSEGVLANINFKELYVHNTDDVFEEYIRRYVYMKGISEKFFLLYYYVIIIHYIFNRDLQWHSAFLSVAAFSSAPSPIP